mmetsp:Transcript_9390/g.31156  ORF Transcript_9390/g.31156 Transcript_9390/m.31156 type:complete len:209 (+) Transcript_9390:100-726(+)|eukprot:scaffold25772_cov136-Isochrysis_galbana.AAC.1
MRRPLLLKRDAAGRLHAPAVCAGTTRDAAASGHAFALRGGGAGARRPHRAGRRRVLRAGAHVGDAQDGQLAQTHARLPARLHPGAGSHTVRRGHGRGTAGPAAHAEHRRPGHLGRGLGRAADAAAAPAGLAPILPARALPDRRTRGATDGQSGAGILFGRPIAGGRARRRVVCGWGSGRGRRSRGRVQGKGRQRARAARGIPVFQREC